MKKRKIGFRVILVTVFFGFISGCGTSSETTTTLKPVATSTTIPKKAATETTSPTETSETKTYTPSPDSCTGWNCTLTGVVYAGSANPGNELEGVEVELLQASYCSPTKGEQVALTDSDGIFTFEVFLHDTDGFNFTVELEGYEPAKAKFGGFDCLYCACEPVEIVLQPIP